VIANIAKDELLRLAKTQVDAWFCSDMIFSSFKILIILHQSKKCEQQKHHLPPKTVEFSRKSIQMFQSLLGSALHAYSGIRYVKVISTLKRYIGNY
jgi:hypothetical protein